MTRVLLATARSFVLLLASIPTALLAQDAPAELPIPLDPALTEPALLRYQFTAGRTDTFHIQVDQVMEVSGAAVGEPAQTTVNMAFDAQQSVAEVDDAGVGQLNQLLENVEISLLVNEEAVPTEDLARLLDGLAMSFRMSGRGQVTDSEVSQISDPQMSQMLGMLQESLQHVTVEFPEEPVAIGHTWSQDLPLGIEQPGMDLTTSVTAQYTFLGYAPLDGQRFAVLRTDVNVALNGTFDDMGLSTTVEGTGRGSGYTYFDNTAGMLSRGRLDMNLDTRIAAEGIDLTQTIALSMAVEKI